MEERDALLDRLQRGELEPNDVETIERLAAEDPAFLRELSFRKALRTSFDELQRTERLAEFEADERWRQRKKMQRWAVAGAIFLMAAAILFWLFGPPNEPALEPKSEPPTESKPPAPTEIEQKKEDETESKKSQNEVAAAEPTLPVWQPDTAFLEKLRDERNVPTASSNPANEWPDVFFRQKGKQTESARALDDLLGDDPEEWKKRPSACFWAATFDLKRTGPKVRTAEFLRIYLSENPTDAVADALLTEALAYRKDSFETAKKRFKTMRKADQKRLPPAVRRALE